MNKPNEKQKLTISEDTKERSHTAEPQNTSKVKVKEPDIKLDKELLIGIKNLVTKVISLIENSIPSIEKISYDQGYSEGIKHLVTLAESFMVKEAGVKSFQELVDSGKTPAFWVATLVTDFISRRSVKKEKEECGKLNTPTPIPRKPSSSSMKAGSL